MSTLKDATVSALAAPVGDEGVSGGQGGVARRVGGIALVLPTATLSRVESTPGVTPTHLALAWQPEWEDTEISRSATSRALNALAEFETASGEPVAVGLLLPARTGRRPSASFAWTLELDQAPEPLARVPVRAAADWCEALAAAGFPSKQHVVLVGDGERVGEARSCAAVLVETNFRKPPSRAWASIAKTVSSAIPSDFNDGIALAMWLEAHEDLDAFQVFARTERELRGRARVWRPVESPRLGVLSGLEIPLPTGVTVHRDARGCVRGVEAEPVSPADLAEATAFVEDLLASNRVALPGHPMAPGQTHELVNDDGGRRRLLRRRRS